MYFIKYQVILGFLKYSTLQIFNLLFLKNIPLCRTVVLNSEGPTGVRVECFELVLACLFCGDGVAFKRFFSVFIT